MSLEQALLDVLGLLERREAQLLAWGVVDGGFTRAEIEEIVVSKQEDYEELLTLGRSETVEALLDRRLLFKYRGESSTLFRTRMAETVRLLSRLRQWFRGSDWGSARELFADFRFALRPKLRPVRAMTPAEVLARLSDEMDIGPTRREAIRAYLGAEASAVVKLARFQYEACARILDKLDIGGSQGTVVTAGTGSGKTHAFYLPAMSFVAEDIRRSPAHYTRVVALYPRQELLKDQLQAALISARRLRGVCAAAGRMIRIGAWFHAVPFNEASIRRAWRTAGRGAYVCPYLLCPTCSGDLVWTPSLPADTALVCRSCEEALPRSEFALTRQELQNEPPDFLFTTTESLNRQLGSSYGRVLFGVAGRHRPRMCLLDEIHTYDGVHGAHVANLIRRWRRAVGSPIAFVGLSATLINAEQFFSDLTGLPEGEISRIEPAREQLERTSDEYLVALRHDPTTGAEQLSATIQTAMLLPRVLDAPSAPTSRGAYGSKVFLFTDRLDSVNALYWQLLDAEGWWSPGRRRNSYTPRALASLRAPDVQAYDAVRDAAGQTWLLPQQLGHDLAGDRQLDLGRTTSQDVGVESRAQLIAATAALEVGFDDDAVGAVIQHKAPHDSARFLQRQGRAGRPPGMRPWTVVVLGDLGKDRLAYQGYERLFSPVLEPKRIPFQNGYVVKMQAVYALIDWLTMELPGHGNVWSELSSPKGDEGPSRRQAQAARLLGEVLHGGPARQRLEQHLRTALALSDEQLYAALWAAPRSLYRHVLPTLQRRLESGWMADGSPGADLMTRDPAPDFIPSRLYGELLVPELHVEVPGYRVGDKPRSEVIGLEQGLREFAPGNVTRRYAVSDQAEYHWIAVPDPHVHVEDLDLQSLYECRVEGVAQTEDGKTVHCLRPIRAMLKQPPSHVGQYDRGELNWQVSVSASATGSELFIPSNSRWSDLLSSVSAYLHRDGRQLTVRRFAPSVTTTHLERGSRLVRTFNFVDGEGLAAAAGFIQEVDGVRVVLDLDSAHVRALLDELVHRREFRWSYLIERFDQSDGFPADVNVFERQWLRIALVCALLSARDPAEHGLASAVQHIRESGFKPWLAAALNVLFRVPEAEPGADHSAAAHSRAYQRLLSLIDDPVVIDALDERTSVLHGVPSTEGLHWMRRRLAVTLAGVILQAAVSLDPGLDLSDVNVEPIEDGQRVALWLTETDPGSTGFIERFVELWQSDPARFLKVAESSMSDGDLQVADRQLLRVLDEATQPDAPVSAAFERLRSAWARGHAATTEATLELRRVLEASGLRLKRAALTTVTGRITAPGSSRATDELHLAFAKMWDKLAEDVGVDLDSRAAAYLASAEDSWDALLPAGRSTRSDKFMLLSVLLWPRGPELSRAAVEVPNRFTRLPPPALSAVDALLKTETNIAVRLPHPEWRRIVDESLADAGSATIEAKHADSHLLRQVLLDFVSVPTDCGYLFSYPRVEAMESDLEVIRLRAYIPESR